RRRLLRSTLVPYTTLFRSALRTEGAEVIVALVHGGLDASPWDPGMDNPGWHVAASGLVDAIVLGHEHRRFPDPRASAPPYAELRSEEHTSELQSRENLVCR